MPARYQPLFLTGLSYSQSIGSLTLRIGWTVGSGHQYEHGQKKQDLDLMHVFIIEAILFNL